MKVFMKVGFLALVLLFSHNLVAQENTQENNDFLNYYNTELFHWSYSIRGDLNLNNQSSTTFFGINKSMQNALALYDDTYQKSISYKKKTLFGNIFLWTGCVAILASQFIQIPDLISPRSTTIYTYTSYGFLGGGLLSAIVGGSIIASGQKNIFDAVDLYNRNKIAEYKNIAPSQR